MVVDGWTISHGDRPAGEGRWMFGHHHPALKAEGLSAPCFLVGSRDDRPPGVLPQRRGAERGGDGASRGIPPRADAMRGGGGGGVAGFRAAGGPRGQAACAVADGRRLAGDRGSRCPVVLYPEGTAITGDAPGNSCCHVQTEPFRGAPSGRGAKSQIDELRRLFPLNSAYGLTRLNGGRIAGSPSPSSPPLSPLRGVMGESVTRHVGCISQQTFR